ncbi:MAG: hypothetical protein QW385_03675 [Thermoproteota archaeon]
MERIRLQIILKTYAWFYSYFMFLMLIFIFVYVSSPLFLHLFFGGGAPFSWVVGIILPCLFIMPFLFYAILIKPKYTRIYSNSKFLDSRLQLVLLYILAFVSYILVAGVSGGR